jgi:acetyl-coenzyme A synthetase (EC 6.2.1.1)
MPVMPEAVYAMLACARIGAVHSAVFAGFSAVALRNRIDAAGSAVLITCDKGSRAGNVIDLKGIVDVALGDASNNNGMKRKYDADHSSNYSHATVSTVPCLFTASNSACSVRTVLVASRTKGQRPTNLHEGRDVWLEEALSKQRPYCPPALCSSEDPLFILYTSGSTGKPKGIVHSTAGYLLYAAMTCRYVFDLTGQPNDRFGCVADIGWITGHTYVLYGPLLLGSTTVLFESTPLHPNASRYWQLVQEHSLTHFYTSPTAIRMLRKHGTEPFNGYCLDSLRVIGSVGETLDDELLDCFVEGLFSGLFLVILEIEHPRI